MKDSIYSHTNSGLSISSLNIYECQQQKLNIDEEYLINYYVKMFKT